LLGELATLMLFRKRDSADPPPQPASAPADVPGTREAVVLAYRLVLGRDVDAEGMAHNDARVRDGSLSLRGLLDELLASDEFKARAGRGLQDQAARLPQQGEGLIRPADVMARHTLEELNATAEEYYRRIPDPAPLLAKPFANWQESPQMLHDLGLVLGGLHLGKTMRVLDFGAGTGWLTRILTQLQCQVYACDVSPTALALGRRLLEVLPPQGTVPYRPVFLQFDGVRIDLPDDSVDRIISFDAFHHVPNPDEVLREFARVLAPGGIAGFSEPGRYHSRSAQSQYEMNNHAVLENDINLENIAAAALAAGFTEVTVRTIGELEVPLADYTAMFDAGAPAHFQVRDRVWAHTAETTFNRTVFFLHKGARVLDSCGHDGLAHHMTVSDNHVAGRAGVPVSISVDITNTGVARWLHENTEIFGIVRLAAHLFNEQGELVDFDFTRHGLPRSVEPGERLAMSISLPLLPAGRHIVVIDLVAEGVTWFENVGSTPVSLTVDISD